jgi:hypothetical protein
MLIVMAPNLVVVKCSQMNTIKYSLKFDDSKSGLIFSVPSVVVQLFSFL